MSNNDNIEQNQLDDNMKTFLEELHKNDKTFYQLSERAKTIIDGTDMTKVAKLNFLEEKKSLN